MLAAGLAKAQASDESQTEIHHYAARIALHIALVVLLPLFATACATSSETAESDGAAPTRTAAASNSKVVCRDYESTASRVRRERVCMTVEEWDAVSRDARDYARGMQNNGSMQPGGESLGP